MQSLYEQLCAQEYTLTCTYTNTAYAQDPLLNKPDNEFVLDSLFTVAELQLGPAAHDKKD